MEKPKRRRSRSAAQPSRAMPIALEEAGAVQRCAVHPEHFKPCAACDRIFYRAEDQRREQLLRETKATHEAWLREHGSASVQRARRQMREQGER